jgi:hypothetical protein
VSTRVLLCQPVEEPEPIFKPLVTTTSAGSASGSEFGCQSGAQRSARLAPLASGPWLVNSP